MSFYDEEVEIFSDKKVNNLEGNRQDNLRLSLQPKPETMSTDPEKMSLKATSVNMKSQESFDSDSEISRSDDNKDNSISPDLSNRWKSLDVPEDIKDCFLYIMKYTPQNITVDYHLQPFIPEYVPAVGDVDAFLKVCCPDGSGITKYQRNVIDQTKKLGLTILDEPSGQQSEPSLLHIKLRSVMTNPSNSCITTAVVKTPKDVDKWMTEIRQLHMSQSYKPLDNQIADIDTLMSEWAPSFEQCLNSVGFPPAEMDCSLESYVRLLCSIFDIPISPGRQHSQHISALSTLFNLFLAINNSYP